MSKMDRTINKIATVTFLSALAIAILPACEKGLMMKDPRVSTPDFGVTVQKPGGQSGEKDAFVVDLKTVQVNTDKTVNSGELVHPDVAESSLQKTLEAQIEFSIGNSQSGEGNRLIKLVAAVDEKSEFNSNGRIASEEGEPEMTWQARCVETDCAKIYVSIAFHFMDKEQKLQDMKFFVVGIHRKENIVKRFLFPNVVELNTLFKQIEALEELDATKTTMPTAENGIANENKGADTTPTASTAATTTPPASRATITTLGGNQLPSTSPSQAPQEPTAANGSKIKVEKSIVPVEYDADADSEGDPNEEL